MYKLISLTLKNIESFRKISRINTNFSLSNKDFFEQYDNSNIIQKLFLRKTVNLLLEENNYIGYIWFEKHTKYHSSINSINVIEDNNLVYCYKILISSLVSNSLITYECEDNGINIDILNKLGFTRLKGVMELELECKEYFNALVPSNITFSIVKKGKNEKERCLLQNEIFKNDDRIPINVEDIYYDEAQEYYFNEGAIFIKLDNIPVGYGQIIVEDKAAIIVNFGIVEKYRKEGYGKVLLRHLLNIAMDNDFSKVSLKVDSNNVFALKLYISLGFNIKKEVYTWKKTKA
ncbi:GNAT family N-acetyltransferase [Clostridium sp. CM028]|uniref:GNAT family N-acetyltransferase n=1 Tax=unclassified Clostridium TaxID=2614128 RepID=UPI001C0CA883|nr:MULTISPECIES: GNAT family N-acetyltransferase [unclassified Clostridium]MBU3092208.1 GNAT family N-acetyltransferase [Clostridium sp. CF011]MBW9147664.1 GNAT family N-acetyltransferase [Clostridium sp. CM028]WAG70318.1 GNAT family N-acetyltransferase [Clostridium sp. CF011]WLC61992.1 GNAT family N-acetyltransferase [Clostridium sp. CM028]